MVYFFIFPLVFSNFLGSCIKFPTNFFKNFLIFLKIFSQKLPKIFPIFLNVPEFFLHLHFFKMCPSFIEKFSILQDFFEISPKFSLLLILFLLKFFKNFKELSFTYKYQCAFLSYELAGTFYMEYRRYIYGYFLYSGL